MAAANPRTFRLSDAQLKALHEAAEAEQRTLGSMVRYIVQRWLQTEGWLDRKEPS